jgi:hypothetical protein
MFLRLACQLRHMAALRISLPCCLLPGLDPSQMAGSFCDVRQSGWSRFSAARSSHRAAGDHVDGGSLTEILFGRRATKWLRLYGIFGSGDPSRIRTCNPRSRNPLLYPVELWDRLGRTRLNFHLGRSSTANMKNPLSRQDGSNRFPQLRDKARRRTIASGSPLTQG